MVTKQLNPCCDHCCIATPRLRHPLKGPKCKRRTRSNPTFFWNVATMWDPHRPSHLLLSWKITGRRQSWTAELRVFQRYEIIFTICVMMNNIRARLPLNFSYSFGIRPAKHKFGCHHTALLALHCLLHVHASLTHVHVSLTQICMHHFLLTRSAH